MMNKIAIHEADSHEKPKQKKPLHLEGKAPENAIGEKRNMRSSRGQITTQGICLSAAQKKDL